MTTPIPRELAAVLEADPESWERFESIPPSHRQEYINWIAEARRSRPGGGEPSVSRACCATSSLGPAIGGAAPPIDASKRGNEPIAVRSE